MLTPLVPIDGRMSHTPPTRKPRTPSTRRRRRSSIATVTPVNRPRKSPSKAPFLVFEDGDVPVVRSIGEFDNALRRARKDQGVRVMIQLKKKTKNGLRFADMYLEVRPRTSQTVTVRFLNKSFQRLPGTSRQLRYDANFWDTVSTELPRGHSLDYLFPGKSPQRQTPGKENSLAQRQNAQQ